MIHVYMDILSLGLPMGIDNLYTFGSEKKQVCQNRFYRYPEKDPLRY